MSFICKELAIETLRSKECVNCTHNMQLACKTCTANECIEAIKGIPEADVDEVKESKWIQDDTMKKSWCCGSCYKWYIFDFPGKRFKYCPNCGTKMEVDG